MSSTCCICLRPSNRRVIVSTPWTAMSTQQWEVKVSISLNRCTGQPKDPQLLLLQKQSCPSSLADWCNFHHCLYQVTSVVHEWFQITTFMSGSHVIENLEQNDTGLMQRMRIWYSSFSHYLMPFYLIFKKGDAIFSQDLHRLSVRPSELQRYQSSAWWGSRPFL